MPAFRNISPIQPSGRIGIQSPAIYTQEKGWQNPETINPHSYHNIKVEPTHALSNSQLSPSSSSSQSIYADSPSPVAPHRSSRSKRRNDPDYIPRPRNAFIIFRSFYVKSCFDTCDGRQNAMSKNAAVVWNSMPDAQKAPFCEQAYREKEEHFAKYPDYTYAPARIGAKKPKSSAASPSSESPSPGPGPASRGIASEPGHGFMPTSEIAPLALSPNEKAIPDFAPEPTFYHHFDDVPQQFGFHQYQTGASDPTLPPLPRSPPGYNTPAPSSLLCDNPYPSASYLASRMGSWYTPVTPTYSFTNDGQDQHVTLDESIRRLDLSGAYGEYIHHHNMNLDYEI